MRAFQNQVVWVNIGQIIGLLCFNTGKTQIVNSTTKLPKTLCYTGCICTSHCFKTYKHTHTPAYTEMLNLQLLQSIFESFECLQMLQFWCQIKANILTYIPKKIELCLWHLLLSLKLFFPRWRLTLWSMFNIKGWDYFQCFAHDCDQLWTGLERSSDKIHTWHPQRE